MADLGIFIKAIFDSKGVQAAKKAFGGLGKEAEKMSAKQIQASKQARDEFGRFVKGSKQGAKESKTSFNSMGKSIKGVGKDVLSNLGPAALAGPAAAITALIVGTGALALDSLKLAENARSVQSAFNSLSGGALIATANMAAMRAATKGLISDTEQMQIANQLLGMKIVSTADQLEEVVGVSRRLGKEFRSLGARDAAEEFAIMIANMSVARLDSFGLSSGEVRKRINELMKETQGMTREAAFFQATMEEGQKTIDRLGPELETTADATSKLSAEWANLKVVMGQAAEGTGVLKNIAKGLSDNLVLLRNWSEAGTDITTKQEALEIQIKRTQQAIENNTTGWITNAGAATRNRVKLVELQNQYAAVTNEIGKNTDAAKAQQAAMEAAIRSEEIAAENLAKREAAEKAFVDVQKQFSKDVIDIQADTQDQLSDSQETFDDDSLKLAENHTKSIAKIRARFAKDETKSAKQLQKNLSKLDANLKKSLAKSEQDEGKKIAKVQSDFAKDDKNAKRRRQIDTLGDERLFQLGLRNLAADGQGIAIKQALEQRAIEQEIASEKAEFEKTVEQDKRKDQISGMRQEGQEARAQLQQQAQERKTDLEARNLEEAEERKARLQEEIIQQNENFATRKADLDNALTERNEAIRESETERIQEIAKGLAATEELTNTQLDRMIALAGEFGPEFGKVFADGMTEAFSENLKIEDALKNSGLNIGASAGGLPIAKGDTQPPGGGGIQPFETGAEITQSGLAFVHKNEVIANPSEGQAITIDGTTFAQRAASQMATAINNVMARNAQMIVDTVAANL